MVVTTVLLEPYGPFPASFVVRLKVKSNFVQSSHACTALVLSLSFRKPKKELIAILQMLKGIGIDRQRC